MVKLKCGDRYIEVDPDFSYDEVDTFILPSDNELENTLELDLGDVRNGVSGETI